MTTEEFIKANTDGDIRRLALQYAGSKDIDLPYALDQIAGRQKARVKLPQWAATDGIIYPPHISMEQCSSEQTARYKADVAARLMKQVANREPGTAKENAGGTSLADLTGGFGVDFSYLAPLFSRAVYIERQSHLCDISRHNMECLGISQAEIVCGDCTQIIEATDHFTMIYADPARRDGHGGRTFAISDCTPDILALKETLLNKADFIMIKLSPMLDWRKAAADMGDCVGEVHIVSAGNECKELLLIASSKYTGVERIYCVNDGQALSFTPEEASAQPPYSGQLTAGCTPGDSSQLFLYEPNASLMKAGCFSLIARRYSARQISRDSHLFISAESITQFPGRSFTVKAITTMNKRELKNALAGIDRANVSVRNFPMTADALRKKLKLKDGGDIYIFGTTSEDGQHLLFVCEKHIK